MKWILASRRLKDWKFLKMKIGREYVIYECFRYRKRAFTIHFSKKLKNYVRKKNEFFLAIEKYWKF